MAQINAAARGPLNLLLSNAGAQWATIVGLGAYIVNPDIFLQNVRKITTGDAFTAASNGSTSGIDRGSPIIIHTVSDNGGGKSSSDKSSVITTVIYYIFGAGCVWVSYSILANLLPDFIGDLMPVTRKVFDRTTKNLATSLVNVKEAMIKQIQFIMKKQDELAAKQDDTHRDVKDIQDDMKFVRSDLSGVIEGIERCEASVEASQRLQSYTARGVKLLVAAVATVLPRDDNHQILRELEKYARDGEQFRYLIERSQSPQNQYNSTPSPPITEPPENEHPRQHQYSFVPTQRKVVPNPKQIDNQTEMDFLAMIRDGTLVVQRS